MDIKVENVSIYRAGVPFLVAVNLTLCAGQAVIIRGPNGVGKTTFLRAFAGLVPTTGGIISPHHDNVAYTGHAYGVKPMLSVLENLMFWAQIYNTNTIDTALEKFDLKPLANRQAGVLSAGQKRRLSLARLIVSQCPVWCLDEPAASLDANSRHILCTVLKDHLTRGGSAVISTHHDLDINADYLDLTDFRARKDMYESVW